MGRLRMAPISKHAVSHAATKNLYSFDTYVRHVDSQKNHRHVFPAGYGVIATFSTPLRWRLKFLRGLDVVQPVVIWASPEGDPLDGGHRHQP